MVERRSEVQWPHKIKSLGRQNQAETKLRSCLLLGRLKVLDCRVAGGVCRGIKSLVG